MYTITVYHYKPIEIFKVTFIVVILDFIFLFLQSAANR